MRIQFGDEYSMTETETVFANTYIACPNVEIRGEKTWIADGGGPIPDFIVVKLCGDGLLVEEKTVTPDSDGHWYYSFSAPKFDKDGKEIKYTIQEGPVDHFAPSYEGYDIVNTYVPPVGAEPLILEEEVTPAGAPLRRFDFLLHAEDGAPLPGGGAGSVKRYLVTGSGMTLLGRFTFTHPGKFVYTVHEVAGGGANWSCDAAQYVLTFTVTAEEGTLMARHELTRNGERVDRLVFRSRYDPPAGG